jgi:predicted transcriptional regulator
MILDVLTVLRQYPQGLFQRVIMTKANLSQFSKCEIIKSLLKRGLIECIDNQKRKKPVRITEEGCKYLQWREENGYKKSRPELHRQGNTRVSWIAL